MTDGTPSREPASPCPDDPRSLSRRALLGAAGGVAALLAGCSLGPSSQTDGSPATDPGTRTDTPTESPTTRTTTTARATPTDLPYDPALAEHDPTAWSRYDPEWTAPSDSPLGTPLATEPLVENLEVPWDLSFAPDGTLFITERVGRVLAFDGGEVRTVAEPAGAIDGGSLEPGSDESAWFVKGGEGGTLGVAAHPTYPDPPLVYVYYTTTVDGAKENRVAYFDTSAERPGRRYEVVLDGIPAGRIHNGGRITFGPANYLWVTTGEGGSGDHAQDLGSLGGKVLRVRPDGSPAPDNPDLGSGADPRIYAYGFRNPQGIVWTPDGTPLVTEHGPGGKDEVNRLEPGANYGWPDVRTEGGYRGSDVHPPVLNTGAETWAPTGAVFYTGDAVPSLSNRLVVGGLISQQVVVTTLTPPEGDLPPAEEGRRFDGAWTDEAYTATAHPTLQDVLGRVRHVEQGPEGDLYAITSNRDGRAGEGFPRERDDVLARIVPAE